MSRLQTQAEANAYWENVEFKKWVVTFSAGSRNRRRTAESLVTSRTATGARKAAIKHQQTERGNDWVSSAMPSVRLATAQDLGCVATSIDAPTTTDQNLVATGWTITKDYESWIVVSPAGQKRRWFEKTTAHDDSPFMWAFLNALSASWAAPAPNPQLRSERIAEIAAMYHHDDDTEIGDMMAAIRVALKEAGAAPADALDAAFEAVRTTQYGPGVSIELSGDEVATAIDAWLVAHGVHVSGSRTVTVNGALCEAGRVFVDPAGFVVADGNKLSGRGVNAEG
ncbi:hypothetical protein G7047_19390 [Diaphorobacter sp. HDW4A]|uniref:hypothetical protein n=1 Tax=Diaphorobacter sp. HDW4A TaxID=2714924 RepID=UPI00140C2DC6|nr:hypothetical protein [Diaphorobacter sp. HDW4A]QIL81840.1 hypothetical protein G7047_19390 [Diaphorobacter sp. HDW4A]